MVCHFSRKILSASTPSGATSTRKPCLVRNSISMSDRAGSSSTTRIWVFTAAAGCDVAEPSERSFGCSSVTGRYIVKADPEFGVLSTWMNPWCASTMPKTTASPNPVPFPFSFVVKNGSKILDLTASDIPVPVSWTDIATYGFRAARGKWRATLCPSTTRVDKVMVPSPIIASRALTHRFSRA